MGPQKEAKEELQNWFQNASKNDVMVQNRTTLGRNAVFDLARKSPFGTQNWPQKGTQNGWILNVIQERKLRIVHRLPQASIYLK